jgi:hypothetical protein
MIQVSLKIDENDDPVLAAWVLKFKGKKSKELSANIRRILRIYINGQAPGSRAEKGRAKDEI